MGIRNEKQIAKDKGKLKKWLKNVLPNDHDKFDLEAHYDGGISFSENKTEITEKIKSFPDFVEKVTASELKSQQEKFVAERNAEIEVEIDKYNTNIANRDVVEGVEDYYQPLIRALNKMTSGYSNLILLKGRGGIGKTHTVRRLLNTSKADFIEICGDTTPAYLYRLLWEHNGKIIYFNDVNKLLRHQDSLNMLKAATEIHEERLITKLSYSKQQEDLPDRFLFKGKIIFDYNYIENNLREDFEAFQSRADYVELAFSIQDIKEIMTLIAVEDWQKDVTSWLVKNYEFTGQNLINLRTQAKAFNTYGYANKKELDWEQEIKAEMKSQISRVRGLLYSLMGNQAMKSAELKKMLMKYGVVGSLRTADRKIRDWLAMEELYQLSLEKHNFYVSINPKVMEVKQ